jgi:hypothetical protein
MSSGRDLCCTFGNVITPIQSARRKYARETPGGFPRRCSKTFNGPALPRLPAGASAHNEGIITVTTTMKAIAALAFFALGCNVIVQPAFADETRAGANNRRAAYQAEGRGSTDFGTNPSTDVLPTVTNRAQLGGINIVTQTDAGLARLLGFSGQGAGGPAPAATSVASGQ